MNAARVSFGRGLTTFGAAWVLLGMLACAPTSPGLDFRVAVVGEDPFVGADSIEIEVLADGSERVFVDAFPANARSFFVGPLPFDRELQLVINGRIGVLPLATGHSFPFTVRGPEGSLDGSPDVTLGLLGTHASVGELPGLSVVRAIIPTRDGALIATSEALIPFLAHGPDGRPSVGTAVPLPAERIGGAFSPLGRGLLVVGGGGATFFDALGAPVASISLPVWSGAAVATICGVAVVVGGRDDLGAPLDTVFQIGLGEGTLQVRALQNLEVARADARALPMEAMSGAGPVDRVIVVDGVSAEGPLQSVLLLDPLGLALPLTWNPARWPHGAAMAAIETGQIMVAGGIDSAGTVLSEVQVLFVHTERPLDFLSPPPEPLFFARSDATLVALAPGVVLVSGGLDAAAAPLDATELADLRVLPGSVRLTGSLPQPGLGAGTMLDDGSVLIASGSALTLYFPYPL